jgi:hypothetical protein
MTNTFLWPVADSMPLRSVRRVIVPLTGGFGSKREVTASERPTICLGVPRNAILLPNAVEMNVNGLQNQAARQTPVCVAMPDGFFARAEVTTRGSEL